MNGMEVLDAIEAILQRMEEKGIGKRQINFKLTRCHLQSPTVLGRTLPYRLR